MLLELILAIILIIFSISMLLFVPLIFGAPYEPSRKKRIQQILKIANPKKTDKIIDIGSGDGRIVAEFAKKQIESHGYEINPWLVLYSKIKYHKLKYAHFHWTNFWQKNLNKFDIIISFQINYIMKKLQKKLNKEIKKPTKIISEKWEFPDWKPKKQIGLIRLYTLK